MNDFEEYLDSDLLHEKAEGMAKLIEEIFGYNPLEAKYKTEDIKSAMSYDDTVEGMEGNTNGNEGYLQRIGYTNPNNWYDTRDYVTRAFDETFGIKDTTSDELLERVNAFNDEHDNKVMTWVDMRDWDNVRMDDTFLDEVLYIADYQQYAVLLVYTKPKDENTEGDE